MSDMPPSLSQTLQTAKLYGDTLSPWAHDSLILKIVLS